MNPFKFSDDNKRYHTLAYHNKHTYGGRVFKATLDAHFSCPNKGGCIYCKDTFDGRSLEEQWSAERDRILAKDENARICAYFGVHTNTFCSPEKLSELLETARKLARFRCRWRPALIALTSKRRAYSPNSRCRSPWS